jgi:hypothetical protein
MKSYFSRAVVIAVVGVSVVAWGVAVFASGPPAGPGQGSGAIATDNVFNVAIGTSTTQSNTKFLVVASSTGADGVMNYPVKVLDNAQNPLFIIRNDGSVAMGTSSFTGGAMLTVAGNIYASGNITCGGTCGGSGGSITGLTISTSSPYNVAVGYQALYSNTTGVYNVAIGSQALQYNTTGYYNTANGMQALANNTTGNYNAANGTQALFANTGGAYNVANGYDALYSNTGGIYNTANGTMALYHNTTGYYNTADGASALANNTTGNYNAANGMQALYSNTTGSNNAANGYAALFDNTTGSNNTANGYQALYSNAVIGPFAGTGNVANGTQALYSNTVGSNNTANGSAALYSNTIGSNNTANGYHTLYSNTGSNNTANGSAALGSNTTGANNIADGSYAGNSNSTGSGNVFLGFQAGYFETGSNKLYIANSNTATPLIYGDFGSSALTVNGNLTVVGTITGTTKNFEIPYPGGEMPGYDLVHSSLEGPEVAVFYRGTANLVNGAASVTLPSYFGALTRTGSETVELTAKGGTPFILSYDSFNHDAGTFVVHGSVASGSFDWQVEATRADVAPLQVVRPTLGK